MQKEILSGIESALDLDLIYKSATVVKSADVERIFEKSLSLKPLASTDVRLLINALGAGEYWGFNKRGDYFSEIMLNPNPPLYNLEYGYKTYEKYGALYPMHIRHESTKLGKVAMALWVDDIKRVFVIVDADKQAIAPFLEILKEGGTIPTSMGTSVKFDACSICAPEQRVLLSMHPDEIEKKAFPGVRFSPREKPCEHIPDKVTQLDKNSGEYIYMINYYPVFKDISLVTSPADESSRVLLKVASMISPKGGISISETKATSVPLRLQPLFETVKKTIIPNSITRDSFDLLVKIAHLVGKQTLLPILTSLLIPITEKEYFELNKIGSQHVVLNSMTIRKIKDLCSELLLKRGSEPAFLRNRMAFKNPVINIPVSKSKEYRQFILGYAGYPPQEHFNKIALFCHSICMPPDTKSPDDKLLRYIYIFKVAGFTDQEVLDLMKKFDLACTFL